MYECGHFQNTLNYLIFQRASEYDNDVNNVCAKLKHPGTKVGTTRFTDWLLNAVVRTSVPDYFHFAQRSLMLSLYLLHDVSCVCIYMATIMEQSPS
jgi:hypothetical protein